MDLPPFDNASMDGYAVRAADVADASDAAPVSLRVLGDIAAGAPSPAAVGPGTALRIMTGAPLPAGADAVVRVEDTDGGTQEVLIRAAAARGTYVRRAGADIATGDVVLPRGVALGPRQLGLLAAIGATGVDVHRQPTVVVIPTGSELLEPGQSLRPGAIFDSISPMLASAIRGTGAMAVVLPPVPDDDALLASALDEAAASADLIVTTGGVSMGAYDTAKAVLSGRGTVTFEKVAMNPGMPQGHGTVGGTPIITLPGNPVSAYVSFEAFVRPAIRTLQGHARIERPRRTARVTIDVTSPAAKTQFVRGILDGTDDLTFIPVGVQDSHVMGGLGAANALAIIPAEQTRVAAGTDVDVWDLREGA
jgi:molybdopterin molybdotransferase